MYTFARLLYYITLQGMAQSRKAANEAMVLAVFTAFHSSIFYPMQACTAAVAPSATAVAT